MNQHLYSLQQVNSLQRIGVVEQFYGLIVEAKGPPDAFLGEICDIYSDGNGSVDEIVKAEVMGFRQGKVLLMPYGNIRGISMGSKIIATGAAAHVSVGDELLGRVVDGFGMPLDDKPPISYQSKYSLHLSPIKPLARDRITEVLHTGVKIIDCLLTVGQGQRIGIFAGSGVGKSTLLGMLAKQVDADVNVIALIGERGREVREFIEDILGEAGLKKSVVVVATADQAAVHRTHAAYAATAIAEYFRAQGKRVVLVMDSITRFAMAQREIGLAVGEPPTARGYTPSVFSHLPQLLERGGSLKNAGSITAFYTVLVEGDDFNEPIADHVRAILDGHIVLTRELANEGKYPPIDILKSTSRLLRQLLKEDELMLHGKVITMISTYQRYQDMVDVGAYQAGRNPFLDMVLKVMPRLEKLLRQNANEVGIRQKILEEIREMLQQAGALS